MQIKECLAQNPIFASLDAAKQAQMADLAIHRRYQRGEIIVLAGEVWPYLLLAEEGQINVLKESSGGRRLLLLELHAGEIFWGPAFFSEGLSQPAIFEAHQACQVVLWPRDSLAPLLIENGQVLWSLCEQIVRRTLQASDIMESLAFQPITSRLARLILDRFEHAHQASIARSLTLDEMAAMLGTTRDVVCRTLYRLADSGLIEITRTEFVMLDEARLAELAEQA